MTPEERRLQIAALVSGDLSESEARRLRAEISHDSDLQELLNRLEEDRRSLQDLPRRKPRRNMPEAVLAAIEEPAIIQLPDRYRRRNSSPGLKVAVGLAACILVAVLVWTRWSQDPKDRALVHVDVQKPDRAEVAHRGSSAEQPTTLIPPELVERPAQPGKAAPAPPLQRRTEPYTHPDDLKAEPRTVHARGVGRVIPATEIGQGDEWQRFCNELSHERQHRLEFFTRNPARCVDSIGKALEARGLAVLTESSANEALRRKTDSMFLVYVEALGFNDWKEILERLAASGEPMFDILSLAASVTDRDRSDLKTVLEVDPFWREQQDQKAPATISKEGLALVALYPPKPGKISAEAGLFVEKRKNATPGVKMCVIVRPHLTER